MTGAHQTDHHDLTTRTWVCTKCGCKCLSKNPWRRNTHFEGPGGLTQSMYLNALQAITLVKRVPARPPRPKEEPFVVWQSGEVTVRDAPFCFVGREEDLALYLDPGNGDVSDTGKPLTSPQERLLHLFRLIREANIETLQAYACGQFGGHEWTDDPALVNRDTPPTG